MIARFDIFMRLPDGHPIWVKTVGSLEEAKKEVAELSKRTPQEYFIFNTMSGQIVANYDFSTHAVKPQ